MTAFVWASLFFSMSGIALVSASSEAPKALLPALGAGSFLVALTSAALGLGLVVGSIVFVASLLAAASLLVLVLPPRPALALPWAYGSAIVAVCLCLYAFSRSGGAP